MTATSYATMDQRCTRSEHRLQATRTPPRRHTNRSLLTGKGTSEAPNSDNNSKGRMGQSHSFTLGRDMERRKLFPAKDERLAYTLPNLNHKQQQVIRGILFLPRIPPSESGMEAEIETVKLPREARKRLAQINPDNFPPVRNSIGTLEILFLP